MNIWIYYTSNSFVPRDNVIFYGMSLKFMIITSGNIPPNPPRSESINDKYTPPPQLSILATACNVGQKYLLIRSEVFIIV
jgi:hypothetical protein